MQKIQGRNKFMKYDNKSRKELIEIINHRNQTISDLEEKIASLEQKLSDENITKLAEDLKKQRKVHSELINQLRNGRAELLRMLGEIDVIINKTFSENN